jgi:alkene monooxygenase beta subunit
VVVATNLCFDRIFGELAKVEYFSRFAAANGDVVTPIIIASSEADTARTLRWTVALMEHLLNDPLEATHNREVVAEWVDKWTDQSKAASEAFRPVFDQAPSKPSTFDEAMQRVEAKRNSVLEPLGLLAAARA